MPSLVERLYIMYWEHKNSNVNQWENEPVRYKIGFDIKHSLVKPICSCNSILVLSLILLGTSE